MDTDIGRQAVSLFIVESPVIDQNYLQCHFFRSQTKDSNMHRKKPQSGRVYRIGEAARALNLQTSVLRFWEGEFPALQPVRTPKGQRLYSEGDMELLRKIRSLLHEQGMTIEGARRVLAGESELPRTLALHPAVSDADARNILTDALTELVAIRALLTNNPPKENHS